MEQKYGIGHMFQIIQRSERTQHLVKVVSLEKMLNWKQFKIQNNVSIFDGVTIEDGVFVGPSTTFTNIKNPRSYINQKNKFIKTIVKKGVSIGANSTIVCGIKLGEYCLVGAGSVVTKNVKNLTSSLESQLK